MKKDTAIIYLTGKPGVGKYTIAKALASNGNYIICDNHLINNPIFELIQYDGYTKIPELAWEAIARIRTQVFEFLANFRQNSYVLTNNLYEDEGDRDLFEEVQKMANLRGSLFIPVKLLVNKQEHLKRIKQFERKKRFKTINPKFVYDTTPLLAYIHPNLLELEVSNIKPEDTACLIMNHIKKINL